MTLEYHYVEIPKITRALKIFLFIWTALSLCLSSLLVFEIFFGIYNFLQILIIVLAYIAIAACDILALIGIFYEDIRFLWYSLILSPVGLILYIAEKIATAEKPRYRTCKKY